MLFRYAATDCCLYHRSNYSCMSTQFFSESRNLIPTPKITDKKSNPIESGNIFKMSFE